MSLQRRAPHGQLPDVVQFVMRAPDMLTARAVVDTCYRPESKRMIVPHRCACCERCWMVVRGLGTGHCVHGGPYLGYVTVADE